MYSLVSSSLRREGCEKAAESRRASQYNVCDLNNIFVFGAPVSRLSTGAHVFINSSQFPSHLVDPTMASGHEECPRPISGNEAQISDPRPGSPTQPSPQTVEAAPIPDPDFLGLYTAGESASTTLALPMDPDLVDHYLNPSDPLSTDMLLFCLPASDNFTLGSTSQHLVFPPDDNHASIVEEQPSLSAPSHPASDGRNRRTRAAQSLPNLSNDFTFNLPGTRDGPWIPNADRASSSAHQTQPSSSRLDMRIPPYPSPNDATSGGSPNSLASKSSPGEGGSSFESERLSPTTYSPVRGVPEDMQGFFPVSGGGVSRADSKKRQSESSGRDNESTKRLRHMGTCVPCRLQKKRVSLSSGAITTNRQWFTLLQPLYYQR